LIQFNNAENVQFFADPTPDDHSEYTEYHEQFVDEPEGVINVARMFSGATGDAEVGVDLLTIAAHEIGHGLGLASSNTASDPVIIVTPPRPFVGLVIYSNGTHLYYPGALMGQVLTDPGVRVLISSLDVLAEAQISRFRRPNLDPYVVIPCRTKQQPARRGRSPGGARPVAR
jgi:hypothetical protein